MDLRVAEIFESVQGESTRAGEPCAFVRLSGCDVGCAWCDTPDAQDATGGRVMSVGSVATELTRLCTQLVLITGGEPLLQREAVMALAGRLLDADRAVMLETSGAYPADGLDPRIQIVMDAKTPSSGATDRFRAKHLSPLDGNDELKFVVADRKDFRWALSFMAEHDTSRLRAVHLSPAWGRLPATELAAWLRTAEVGSNVRLTVQLHKLLGVR